MNNILKNNVFAATMLATSSVWGKSGDVKLGVNALSLQIKPAYNTTFCIDDFLQAENNIKTIPDRFGLLFDISKSRVSLDFSVSNILNGLEDQILILVYSSATVPTPQMPIPSSDNQLLLDIARMEILAMYDMPAKSYLIQNPTRIGVADPNSRSKVSFSVNLGMEKLFIYKNNNDAMYFQAALLNAKDYAVGKYEHMILSELKTIYFTDGNECPTGTRSIGVDADGKLIFSNQEENCYYLD